MGPTSWQDEALAREGVSREVPCSALKGETFPDSLPATPKSPPTRRVPPRGTPRVPAPLPLSPFSPPDIDRRGDSPAYFCFIDYAKAFDCVDRNKLWKILKEIGIPDHLISLLRNLYASS